MPARRKSKNYSSGFKPSEESTQESIFNVLDLDLEKDQKKLEVKEKDKKKEKDEQLSDVSKTRFRTSRQRAAQQSNVQKLCKKFTGAHICKNLPSEVYRKIKNYLGKIKKNNLLDLTKKRLSIDQLIVFISTSELTQNEWNQILDLPTIYAKIDKSKMIGKSKNFKKLPKAKREFLIWMNKMIQKVLYQSVTRMVSQVLNKNLNVSYLDDLAHIALHELDKKCENSSKYNSEYQSLLSSLN